MENKSLFNIAGSGYNCDEVDNYIEKLKAEYKKIYEHAKTTQENNEKLKKICRVLSDENKALKADGAQAAAPAAPAIPGEAIESTEKISALVATLVKESDNLKALLK